VPVSLLSINYNLEMSWFVIFNAQINLVADNDCIVTLNYYINNAKVGQTPLISLSARKPFSVSLYNCFQKQKPGSNTLTVLASIERSGGEATIKKGELIATVSGQYMVDTDGTTPDINVSETIELLSIAPFLFNPLPFRGEIKETKTAPPHRETMADTIESYAIAAFDFDLLPITDIADADAAFISAHTASQNRIKLLFTNRFSFNGHELNLDGFRFLYGHRVLEIHHGTIAENALFLTVEEFDTDEMLIIQYNSDTGNLYSRASGNPVKSFNYVIVD